MPKQNTATLTQSCELDASEPRRTLSGMPPFSSDSAELDQSYEAAGCWTPVAMRLALGDSDEDM